MPIKRALETPISFLIQFLVLQVSALLLACVFLSRPLELLFTYDKPMDFIDFLQASAAWLKGQNPYDTKRFVTPPFSLLVLAPWVKVHPVITFRIFALVNFGCFAYGLHLLRRKLTAPLDNRSLWLLITLSYPTLFLIQRGNFDGLVFLGVALFVAHPKEAVRTLGLAVAILLKLYPALLLLPLVLQKRFRELGGVLLLLAVLSIPFGALNLDFLDMLKLRGTRYASSENFSLTGFYSGLVDLVLAPFGFSAENHAIFPLLGLLTFTVLLALVVRKLIRTGGNRDMAYLPFLMLVPAQVFPYVGIFGIVYILQLESWENSTAKRTAVLGASLIAFHATAWNQLTDSSLWHAVNPLGGFLLATAMAWPSKTSRQI